MLQDPVDADAVELDMTNPEFKKLAFTAPGPKNSFAPVKQDNYRRVSKQRDPQCSECVCVRSVCMCEVCVRAGVRGVDFSFSCHTYIHYLYVLSIHAYF